MLGAGLRGGAHQLALVHECCSIRRHRLCSWYVTGEELCHVRGGEGCSWRHQQWREATELAEVIKALVRWIEYSREVVWAHDGEGCGVRGGRGEGGCLRQALSYGGGWGQC